MDDAVRSGLAAWQQKLATELLSENLDGELSLADIAAERNRPAGHVPCAFGHSMGTPPHRTIWRLKPLHAGFLRVYRQQPGDGFKSVMLPAHPRRRMSFCDGHIRSRIIAHTCRR